MSGILPLHLHIWEMDKWATPHIDMIPFSWVSALPCNWCLTQDEEVEPFLRGPDRRQIRSDEPMNHKKIPNSEFMVFANLLKFVTGQILLNAL